ncbi:MAG: TraR/DksA C4-type zinc finger protein [Rhodospirillaceae bacterium]
MKTRKDIDFAALRRRLTERRAELEHDDVEHRADRAPVELDQQVVGRVSRMDAMQSQAMAQATHERRLREISRIDAALKRLDVGDYGYCVSCDKPVAAKRLDLDPAVPTCIKCASAAEHREG